jgi:DNA-binding beta-propeller fold protein YncE
VAVDNKGNVYVTDIGNTRVRKITPTGVVSNLGPADFIDPKSLTVDAAGNVYVADVGEALVKKITPSGDISLIAGIPGTGGTYTLDGIATVAVLYGPLAITVDKKNNLYISDGNDVRRINYE